jgi:general secretion pathway protein G
MRKQMSWNIHNPVRRNEGRVACRQAAPTRNSGFTLLEMMVVIVVIMILAAVAATSYKQHVIQAREAVLHENLRAINRVIQEYTLDTHKAPQTLEDLTTAGYLHEIPIDPMTRQADWTTEEEDSNNAADPQEPGIIRVHSASTGTAIDGTAYSSW